SCGPAAWTRGGVRAARRDDHRASSRGGRTGFPRRLPAESIRRGDAIPSIGSGGRTDNREERIGPPSPASCRSGDRFECRSPEQTMRLLRSSRRLNWVAIVALWAAAPAVVVGSAPARAQSPAGPLSLDDLERLALSHNPTLAQATAQVDAAHGRAIQAGLYPNPTVGYFSQQIGEEGTAGQQGAFLTQVIVTGGKLRLNRAK